MRITVSAGSRIHLGFIDPLGLLGRRWGSIGLYLDEPRLSMTVTKCEKIIVNGPEWLRKLVEEITMKLGVSGLRVECLNHIPRHVGLGSGTQTILSIGSSISMIYELDLTVEEIALIFDRCKMSGVGYWLFQKGGLIIDGGKSSKEEIPPLLFRADFPEDWTVLLAVPTSEGLGLHGSMEEEGLKRLSAADPKETSLTVLMKLLPSIIRKDFEKFTEAVEDIDIMTSRFFEPVQSGRYFKDSQKVVESMKNAGVRGVGQSSWGPTIYGFVERSMVEEIGRRLEKIDGFRFIFTKVRNIGAEILQL
ncbi:MAG: beta-ribofuranosylaminobenzene 5'-phosphate synthase family protein [Candidatus Caldarchaeales archaeon]